LSSRAADCLMAAIASRSAFSDSVVGSEPVSIHNAIPLLFVLVRDSEGGAQVENRPYGLSFGGKNPKEEATRNNYATCRSK
jgi:hypothetical protein